MKTLTTSLKHVIVLYPLAVISEALTYVCPQWCSSP